MALMNSSAELQWRVVKKGSAAEFEAFVIGMDQHPLKF